MARLVIILLSVLLLGCIEPAEFDVPPAESLLIIEGGISDQPGPYTVKVSRAIPLSADALNTPPVTDATIRLHDDLGNIEDFEETSPGIYETRGAIQGQVGRSYYITVTTAEGEAFESLPEEIRPVGEVTEIRHEYVREREEDFFGEINKDYFNIYVNAPRGMKMLLIYDGG